jgi:putative intracellular protease/amidase
MLLQSILFAISSASLVFFASAQTGGPTNGAELPVHWGVLIFPGFDHLDVFGPVEYLSMIGLHNPTKFYLIAPSMDPVTSRIPPTVVLPPAMKGEGIEVKILPTHTLDNAPPLDILLVPGGPGSRVEVNNTAIPGFIKNRYPVRNRRMVALS